METLPENLSQYLSSSLLESLNSTPYSSPVAERTTSNCTSPENFTSSSMTPSPQIPPLESRLHSYLLRKTQHTQQTLTISTLFSELNFESEVEHVVNFINKQVQVFEELKQEGFFKDVFKQVEKFKKTTKFNALAKSFTPVCDKENMPIFKN